MEEQGRDIIEQKQRYTPAMTAELKKSGIREVLKAHRKIQRLRTNLDLYNKEAVEKAIDEYMSVCEENCILPSIVGFCSMVHINRAWFYEFIDMNKGTDCAHVLENLMQICASVRMSAVDRGSASEAFSIFLLKNSNLGFADRVELAPVAPQSPLNELGSAEEARKRILEGLPDPEDGDGE